MARLRLREAVVRRGQTVPDDPRRPGPAAFVYSQGQMIQLDEHLDAASAGWELQVAQAINNDGVIVGLGAINGAQHGFVATPVSK